MRCTGPRESERGRFTKWKLLRTLYGLKQSSRDWNVSTDEYLRRIELQPLETDQCLYVWRSDEDVIYIVLFLDDLLIETTRGFVQRIIAMMS